MSVDFPRAWQIARATPAEHHNPKCSYRVGDGGLLCDCEIVTQHSEYLDDILQGVDGIPCTPARADTGE